MTELLLYQKRLQYVTQRLNGDTYDSVNLTIDQEEKIVPLEGSIKKFLEEHQEANSSLSLLNDNLNKCKEQDQAHQLRFDELKAHERTIEESIELNEKKLREIESEIMQLEKKKTLYLSEQLNQERLLIKIKTCRKLKLLDRKKEGILGSDLYDLKHKSENARTSDVCLNFTIFFLFWCLKLFIVVRYMPPDSNLTLQNFQYQNC